MQSRIQRTHRFCISILKRYAIERIVCEPDFIVEAKTAACHGQRKRIHWWSYTIARVKGLVRMEDVGRLITQACLYVCVDIRPGPGDCHGITKWRP